MKQIAALLTCLLMSTMTARSQHAALPEAFANAQWIALEADSTILFPHVHLLKAKSEKGQSLKRYELPVLTKSFSMKEGKVKRARVDICGLGQYELFINGQKAGDYFLSPGWTMYDKELLYNELDVTPLISAFGDSPSVVGDSLSVVADLQSPSVSSLIGDLQSPTAPTVIEVMLGGGMYDIPLKGYHKMAGSCGAPKLLLALHIEYADGKRQTIVTDSAWTACESPVTYSSIYAGESYDATIVGEASKLCTVSEASKLCIVGEASKLCNPLGEASQLHSPVVSEASKLCIVGEASKLCTVGEASKLCRPVVGEDSKLHSPVVGEASQLHNPHPTPVIITHPHWDVPLVKQDDHTRLVIKKELPMTLLKADSTLLYDMGQNCSGIVRLTVRGKRGSKVTLRPAEILRNGTVYQRCMPGYAWTYTLHGPEQSAGNQQPSTTAETWQPQFSYTGFRYVEVQADEGVEVLELTGLHTSADVAETGRFECSDTLLNRIYTLIDWAVSSNLASITTDCPTREKLGWQEQNHLMAYSMMYRYDMQALMNKIADDLADSQHPDGTIPTIAPEYTLFDKGSGFEDTPEWGASFILCPYYTYLWYGDDTAMRRHYDAMKRYIDYLESRTNDHILDYGLGDWYDIGPERPGFAQLTSVALSATAMYYYELCVMSRIANHLADKPTAEANNSPFTFRPSLLEDAQRFETMAAKVKLAFNARFWNKEQRQYERGSQTASAMALFMGLTTDENRSQVLQKLVDDINTRMDSVAAAHSSPFTLHTSLPPVVTAGDVGYRYVLQALREGGCDDVIWRMNRYDDIPGYAYQLRQGATALTESWQAYDNVSNNHLMLGHLMEWLFQAPGGIRQADGSAAWRHIIIEPQMLGTLTWANTSYLSPQGLIACHWTASPERNQETHCPRHWTVSVTIPSGTVAEIRLPDGSRRQVGAGNHQFENKP